MELSAYQRFAYRRFGRIAKRSMGGHVRLRSSLLRAHVPLRPEVYLSYALMNMVLALLLSGVLVGGIFYGAVRGAFQVAPLLLAFLAVLPFLLSFTVYLVTLVVPDLRASSRAGRLDANLPYALNYVSTMTSAGQTLPRVLESLSRQAFYGEVAEEAAWIVRDLKLLGKDLLSALAAASDRSPSYRFQDLLQGTIASLASGADLASYFRSKSEQFTVDARQDQRRTLDSFALLSEAFVTVVVAAPILLLILLSVLTLFGTPAGETFVIGYAMILLLLPAAQFGFSIAIKSLSREA